MHAADDNAALVRGLRAGEAWAQRALLDRHTEPVERLLTRMLGASVDLDDLVQEVFVRAFERVGELRDPSALRSWLLAIAVYVGYEARRRRRRRQWLVYLPLEETPEIEMPAASHEARATLRAFYEIIGHLDRDSQIPFALRFVEGMELAEIAAICGVSLATIKRRLKKAEAEFFARGRAHEALADWFKEGTRWG